MKKVKKLLAEKMQLTGVGGGRREAEEHSSRVQKKDEARSASTKVTFFSD